MKKPSTRLLNHTNYSFLLVFRVHLVIFLLLASLNIYSQYSQSDIDTNYFQGESINQRDSNGLKIGKWIYLEETGHWDSLGSFTSKVRYTLMGYYKTIFISDTSDYVKDQFQSDYYFSHQDKTGLFFAYSGRKGNYFSVADGLWLFNINGGEIERIDDWNSGYRKASYELEKGEIVEVSKRYLKNNYPTEDTYEKFDDFVYKRWTVLHGGFYPDYKDVTEYYPDCEVNMKKNSIYILSTLGESDTSVLYLYSNSSDTLSINHFSGFSDQITLLDKSGNYLKNAILLPFDSVKVKIVYTPNRDSLSKTENIYFKTNRKCNHTYTIHVRTRAFDIHRRNIKKLSNLVLVKDKKPLFLYVSDIEWHTFIEIYDSTKQNLLKKDFLAEGENKGIDISDLPKGKYVILAKSQHEYEIKLVIE